MKIDESNGVCYALCFIILVYVTVQLYNEYTKKYRYEHFGDNQQTNVASQPVCRRQCDSLGGSCLAYTYNPVTRICNLITSMPSSTGHFQAGTTSYYLASQTPPSFMTSVSFVANASLTYDSFGQIAAYTPDSVTSCSQTCQTITNCIGFVYDTDSSKAPYSCVLHSDWGTNASSNTAVTYVLPSRVSSLARSYVGVQNIVFSTAVDPDLIIWYAMKGFDWYSGAADARNITNLGGLGTYANAATQGMNANSGNWVAATGRSSNMTVFKLSMANQYLSISPFIFGGTSFTICFFVNIPNTLTSGNIINFNNNYGSSQVQTVILNLANSGNLYYSTNDANGTNPTQITGTGLGVPLTSTAINDGTWRFMALVCTLASGTTTANYSFFMNSVGTAIPSTFTPTTTFTGPVPIIAVRQTNNLVFNMLNLLLDDFRIYNNALTADTLKTMYNLVQ